MTDTDAMADAQAMADTQAMAEALGHPDARELLRSAPLARLGCNGPDGLPRVIPIGFYWNGEQLVVCTATTAPKVRALTGRPDVALTIDAGDSPATARSLAVRGVATMETVDGVPEEYLLAASTKSRDGIDLAEFEPNVRAMYDRMVRISIEPRWARSYHFGQGRMPAFLTKLASDLGGGAQYT
jgi:nitroimidazol reductase NimA-like FMN-containing flavoprotein (pyridoxamine 5'-phosphate oxidase superfamily)